MSNSNFPMHVTVVVTDLPQLRAVYAVLAGASPVAVAVSAPSAPVTAPMTLALVEKVSQESDIGTDEVSDDVLDAHGWAWSADLHASTRGTTKDGLWRMKIGVTRPEPKPGFPAASTESAAAPAVEEFPETGLSESVEIAGEPSEDDEFAAFRAAATKSDAEDAAAQASVPARKWTDADLGALCNQAATKLGDPLPVKAIIAEFTPEGEVAHSRNIPQDRRAEFAKAVEAKAGIEFAG